MIRGGAWNNEARNVRSANRNNDTPDNRNDNNGFRLASPPALMVVFLPGAGCVHGRTGRGARVSMSPSPGRARTRRPNSVARDGGRRGR